MAHGKNEGSEENQQNQETIESLALNEADLRLLQGKDASASKRGKKIMRTIAREMKRGCQNPPGRYQEAVYGYLQHLPLKARGFVEAYIDGNRNECMRLLREFNDVALQVCGVSVKLIKETRLSLGRFEEFMGNLVARPVRGYKHNSGEDDRFIA